MCGVCARICVEYVCCIKFYLTWQFGWKLYENIAKVLSWRSHLYFDRESGKACEKQIAKHTPNDEGKSSQILLIRTRTMCSVCVCVHISWLYLSVFNVAYYYPAYNFVSVISLFDIFSC